uniref:Uncharacterized protein n=1 Tax=Arundo donax TaxID=35708 RepID=A0A0A9AGT3_ARUDO
MGSSHARIHKSNWYWCARMAGSHRPLSPCRRRPPPSAPASRAHTEDDMIDAW